MAPEIIAFISNLLTHKKHMKIKRGTKRKDGAIFWQYGKTRCGNAYEQWARDAHQFEFWRNAHNEAAKREAKRNRAMAKQFTLANQ